MILNPITKQLFTSKGEFIKQLHCPLDMTWHNLQTIDDFTRKCKGCDNPIFDTTKLKDEEVLELVRNNPTACLKVGLEQDNIIVTNNRIKTND